MSIPTSAGVGQRESKSTGTLDQADRDEGATVTRRHPAAIHLRVGRSSGSRFHQQRRRGLDGR